jgi:pimeloyl-ACP methyl ester carboxylesterase
MKVLFVHGLGRSPLSGWPLLRQLNTAGFEVGSFGYLTSVESFSVIAKRLAERISNIASQGEYVLIGHSLGGVLIRVAVNSLPAKVRRPTQVFLLGSPCRASRLAQRFGGNPVFRWLSGDCGVLLGSEQWMSRLGSIDSPTTGIAGVKGVTWRRGPFGGEPNDGIVTLSEVSAEWLVDQVKLPVVHTLLPASKQVAGIIIERLRQAHAHSEDA